MKSKEAMVAAAALVGATTFGIYLERNHHLTDYVLDEKQKTIEWVDQNFGNPPISTPQRPVFNVENAPTKIPVQRVEQVRQPLAFGTFSVERPDILSPKGKVNGFFNKKDRFSIYGYGKSPYTFSIGGIDEDIYEVPIEQMLVLDGMPLKQVKRNSKLGIRNQDPALMKDAALLGADRVRIAGNNLQLSDPKVEKALRSAKENGLKVLYVINPSKTIDEQELEKTVRIVRVLSGGQVTWEIGNEMDNKDYPFWEEDPESFYKFTKVAIDVINRASPGTKIIIGALVDTAKTKELVDGLRRQGVNTDTFIYGVHSYETVEDLEKRVASVRSVVGEAKLWITELGVYGKEKKKIAALLDAAKRLNVEGIEIHELEGREGFGYLDGETNKPDYGYFYIQYWSQNNL